MGDWYRVTKTIHGRYYDYWQRTERHGKQVKTFNKYIGPTSTSPIVGIPASAQKSGSSLSSVKIDQSNIADSSAPISAPPNIPATSREVMKQFNPHYGLHKQFQRILDKNAKMQRREVERIQYASCAARIRKMEKKIRVAKRGAKGAGATNAFLGRAVNRLRDKN
jgi:hypothetical protein